MWIADIINLNIKQTQPISVSINEHDFEAKLL